MNTARKIIAADLFCGGGGATEGLVEALRELGVQPEKEVHLIAVNHWRAAIETHRQNHPWATHFLSGVDAVDPRRAVPGGRMKILVAGPECTHHARARGGRPMKDQSRASAWLILKWLQELYVENVLIENVEEFMDWGPLNAKGRPIPSKKGETFKAFVEAVRSLGYRVEWRVLCAADYGDATTRKRFFLIARRGNRKIEWPKPSHAPAASRGVRRWVAARKIINWSKPGRSIFMREQLGLPPLADTTLARIEAGLVKFLGVDLATPFIVALRQHVNPRSVQEPLPTIAAEGTHLALVQPVPFLLPQQSGGSPRSIDKPSPTISAKGAVSLVHPYLVTFYGERDGQKPRTHDVDKPVPTIPCDPKIGVVQPFLVNTNHDDVRVHSVDDPLRTGTTKNGTGVVVPFLVTPGSADLPKGSSVDKPLPTVMPRPRFAVVTPFIVSAEHTGANGKQVRDVKKPLPTVTSQSRLAVVTPFVVQVNHKGGKGRRVQSVDDPLRSITAEKSHAVVTPFILPHLGRHPNNKCQSVDKPLPTVTASHGVGHLVTPYLVKFYGDTKTQNQSVQDPMHTITAKERFGLVAPKFDELPGPVYGLDILFRMLDPEELAAAMSFPKKYVFVGGRTKATRMIGNAWPIRMAKALCLSILKE